MGKEAFEFHVGDQVEKTSGDYTFEGVVVAAFHKKSGLARYVVEDDRGILHVYNARILGLIGRAEDAVRAG